MPKLAAAATALAALIGLCALAGCTTMTPTPTAPPVTAATPSSDASLTKVTTIEIDVDQVRFLDESGTQIVGFAYSKSPAAIIAAATTVFGKAPELADTDAGAGPTEVGPSTDREWDGFVVAALDAPGPMGNRFYVAASTAKAGKIAITTPDGLQVGATFADVVAVQPDYVIRTTGLVQILEVDGGTSTAFNGESLPVRIGLALTMDAGERDPTAASIVTAIRAPSANAVY